MDGVHLESLPDGSILARTGGTGWSYGDPYENMVVVVPIDEETCEIRGLVKLPTREQWRTLRASLRGRGYLYMEFDRNKNGIIVPHRRIL